MFRPVALTAIIVLAGCASQPTPGNYARTDGHPVDANQAKVALAECLVDGQAARRESGLVFSNERTAINACMARNGYVTQ